MVVGEGRHDEAGSLLHLQTTLTSLPLVSAATILPLRKPDSNVCACGWRHQYSHILRSGAEKAHLLALNHRQTVSQQNLRQSCQGDLAAVRGAKRTLLELSSAAVARAVLIGRRKEARSQMHDVDN